MRFTLRDDGYNFKKIVRGKKWIGRVYKDANGMYVGMIGHTTHRDVSELTAFEGVVGAVARHAANEMLRGNFDPFEKLFLKN